MRNRFSSHLLVLFALVVIEVVGYYAIHRAAMIRGYETSVIAAPRDLLMYFPIIVIALWASAFKNFKGEGGALHARLPAVLNRTIAPTPPVQRSGIQRQEQSRRASGKDRHIAHALYQSELRHRQATDDGIASRPSACRTGSAGQRIELHSGQCADFQLHMDSGFFVDCFCAGVCVLRE